MAEDVQNTIRAKCAVTIPDSQSEGPALPTSYHGAAVLGAPHGEATLEISRSGMLQSQHHLLRPTYCAQAFVPTQQPSALGPKTW